MKALNLTQQDLIVQALDAEFTQLDMRVHCKALTNANAALRTQKERLTAECKLLREERRKIAGKLDVPETAADCIQRIVAVESELQTVVDKLSVVIGDRDGMQATRDAYAKARDCFKSKYEACESERLALVAKLAAYESQGWWDRVLGRKPC